MQTNLSDLLVLKAPATRKRYTHIVFKQTTNYQNPSVCSAVMSWAEGELERFSFTEFGRTQKISRKPAFLIFACWEIPCVWAIMFSVTCATLHTSCAKKQILLTCTGPQAGYQLKLSSSEQVLCLHHSSLAAIMGVTLDFSGCFLWEVFQALLTLAPAELRYSGLQVRERGNTSTSGFMLYITCLLCRGRVRC